MDRKKILIILSVVFVLAVVVFVSIFTKKDTQKNSLSMAIEKNDIIIKAIELANNGNFQEAQKILSEEISKNTTDALRIVSASIYLDEGTARGNVGEASKKAQEVLSGVVKNKETQQYYNILGYSHEIIGEFDKALENYEKALSFEKNSPETLFNIGHLHFVRGDIENAALFYSEAEKNLPANDKTELKAKVYTGMGNVSSDYVKAIEYFKKSNENSSSRRLKSLNFSNLANIKLLQNDSIGSLEYAQKALEEDSSNGVAHLSFAKAAMSEKNIFDQNKEKVAESLLKAILLSSKMAEPQYWQGKFDFITGKNDLALKSFETAISLVAEDKSLSEDGRRAMLGKINLDMAIIYHLKGDNENMKKYAKEAILNNPVEIMYILQNTATLKGMYSALDIQ